MSLAALRENVRAVDVGLANEITDIISRGDHVRGAPYVDEDEYSYPPEPQGVTTEDLLALGVQVAAPSKRRIATTRLYAAPLSDEDIAAIRAKVKGGTP